MPPRLDTNPWWWSANPITARMTNTRQIYASWDSTRVPQMYVARASTTAVAESVAESLRQLTMTAEEAAENLRRLGQTEGETMPEVGQADPVAVSIPLDGYTRRSLFTHLDLGFTLPTSMSWSDEQTRFEEAASPVTVNVVPGSNTVPTIKKETAFGRFEVESVPLNVAEELVRVASNGRLMFERLDLEPGNWLRIVPVLPVEAAAYINGRTTVRLQSFRDGEAEYVYVGKIQSWLKDYRLWRRDYFRDHFREMFGRRSGRLPALPHERGGVEYDSEGNVIGSNARDTLDQGKFTTFIESFRSRLQVTENPFSDLEILPRQTLSSRTWGIEIEAVNIDNIQTPKYWVLHGDGSLRGIPIRRDGQTEHAEDCDTLEEPFCDCGSCTNDCSCGLDSDYERLTETGEWNSPVLRSYHSRGLEYLCSELEGRESNDTPGIHVHIGAADLTPEQATQVSLIYTLLEPLFENEYGRNTRRYCESVTPEEQVRRFKKMRVARQERQTVRQMQYTSRYWTVNLAALSSHGTIEFRAMGPRYNYEHLIRWAHFLRELVNIAKAGVTQKQLRGVKTFRDLIAVFAKYGKETATPEWVEPGAVASFDLASETRQAPNPAMDPSINIATVFDGYRAREYALASDRHTGDRATTGVRM